MQFGRDGSVVAGLKPVRQALQATNPQSLLNFLAQADSRLGNRKPIELLKSGDLDIVLEAAQGHDEQGA